MFLLCPVILFSLAGSSYGFTAAFIPSKLTIPRTFRRPSTNNVTKPTALNHDFSALVLGLNSEKKSVPTSDKASDSSLQKKIEEATVPLEQTIVNLTKTNIHLKSQISNLKEVNSQKTYRKQECSAASKQVKSLTTKLSKTDGKVKSLTAELSNAEERGKSQTAKVKEAQQKVKDMIAMLGTEEEKVKTLQREKLELKSKLDKLTKQKTRQDKPREQKKAATRNWPSKPTGGNRCPRGFTDDKEARICFRLVRDQLSSYNSAEMYCKENRGRLAVLNTYTKFRTVIKAVSKGSSSGFFFFSKRPTISFWVGSQTDRYGQMKWSDGTSMSRSVWAPGEPNGKIKQCGELDYRKSFRMNDENCDKRNHFVCEFV